MGSSEQKPNNTDVYNQARVAYNQTLQPSQMESDFRATIPGYQESAEKARATQMADYGNIMSGYQDYMKNLGDPTKFSYNKVSAQRPAELDESYGYLREAAPGYREFAKTGGYSPTDIQELRARGINPIRASYGTTMRELDRARALGGPGGAPNYIAAVSRANRELPGQMADAMTTVNANLAEQIRAGRLQGLAGLSGIGSTMGGLSSSEASRILQADLANQRADFEAQQASEASRWNLANARLQGLHGQTSLYGTTPAMAATFGNQALNAWGQGLGAESARMNRGVGLIDAQLRASMQEQNKEGWFDKLMKAGAAAAPFIPNGQGGQPGQGGYGNNSRYNGGVGQEAYNPNDAYWNGGYGYDPTGNYGGDSGWVNGPGWNEGWGNNDPYFDPSFGQGGDPSVPPPSSGGYYGGGDYWDPTYDYWS